MSYSLCGTSVDNLGQQECDKARGVLSKIAIDNGIVSSANYASTALFHAELVRKSKLSKNAAEKLFILPEIQDLTLNNESNKDGSLNQGFKTVLLEGKPGYKFKFFGGADLLKRCRTFNNVTVRIREYDANGVWWSTKISDDSKGFQAKLFFAGGDIATGQNVEEGVIECTVSILSNSEYKQNAYWVETSAAENVEDIVPLIDVALTNISHSTNVWKIGMYINGSNMTGPYNIFDEHGAAIAALTFTAGTGTNYGTSLAITSVAVDNTLKCLTVTFDSTTYNALAGGTKIKLIPPSIAVLDAADVTETELLYVILTK
jgi:hypothetical protein